MIDGRMRIIGFKYYSLNSEGKSLGLMDNAQKKAYYKRYLFKFNIDLKMIIYIFKK